MNDIGIRLATILPEKLGTDVANKIIIRYPIREIVQYYRHLDWNDLDIFSRIFKFTPDMFSFDVELVEQIVTLSATRNIRADLDTLRLMNPLVSLSHMLWNTYVGMFTEVVRYIGQCMAVLRYTLIALEEVNLGRSIEAFLISIFKRIRLEDIASYFNGVKFDSITTDLIYESGNLLLLDGIISEAGRWLSDDKTSIALRLTILGCQRHDANFLRYLQTKGLFDNDGYKIYVSEDLTNMVLNGNISAEAFFRLSFDIGYRRLRTVIDWSNLSQVGLFSGLLFSGYDGDDLESYLPFSEHEMMALTFMEGFIGRYFVESGYSFKNGVPKNWARLLQAEPALRQFLFILAGIAGQGDVVDQMLQDGFPVDTILDASIYFPNEIIRKLDPFLRETRPVINLQHLDIGVPRNWDAYEFLRPYLGKVSIDGLPSSLVRTLYPEMYTPAELTVYLNDQSFSTVIDLDAIEGILVANQIKPADINVQQLWILRHEMRALLGNDSNMREAIHGTMLMIGTSVNFGNEYMGKVTRSDLAPPEYPPI